MKFKRGDLLNHYSNFDGQEELLSSHLILENKPGELLLYCSYSGFPSMGSSKIQTQGKGGVKSEMNTSNNFYWRIDNEPTPE